MRMACCSLCIDSFPAAGGLSDDGYNGWYVTTNDCTVQTEAYPDHGSTTDDHWPEWHIEIFKNPITLKVSGYPPITVIRAF